MTAIILIIARNDLLVQRMRVTSRLFLKGNVTSQFVGSSGPVSYTLRVFNEFVMAERRRSAHAIDDQNNGGRSQQENHVTRYIVIYLDQCCKLAFEIRQVIVVACRALYKV